MSFEALAQLAQLDRAARDALCAGPAAAEYGRAPDGLAASAFGSALLEARDALHRARTPAAALHLAALSARARVLAPPAPTRGTLAPLEAPEPRVGTPLAADELDEVLTALRGDYEDGELVLARALSRGRLPDLRVLPFAVDALRKTRIAPFVAHVLLPAYGPLAARRLRAGFDPQGRTSHAWRVAAAARIAGPDADSMLREALAAGSRDVRLAALADAPRVPWQLVEPAALELAAQARSESEVPWFLAGGGADPTRAPSLFTALARCPTDAALDALFAGLTRVGADYGWEAASALRDAAHPSATERLLRSLDRALRSSRSGPDEVIPAALLHALAAPRHAAALDPLRALAIDPRDALAWFAHRNALASLGDEAARAELASYRPTPAALLALRRHSVRPLLAYAGYVFDPARLATPAGLECAAALLDSYVPRRDDSVAEWAAVYAPALAHPSLFKPLRRNLDADHGRSLRALDPAVLYDALAPLVGPDAPERQSATVLGWVSQWPPSSVDPRWADMAAQRLAAKSVAARSVSSARAVPIALLAAREDPRCIAPLRAMLAEDLRKRARSGALADALAVYRPAELVSDLVARLAAAKPKSWAALYLERLLDRARQPRFARAAAGSWVTE